MQQRQSHKKLPSEVIHSNNYYIIPKSLKSSQTSASSQERKKVASTKNIDQFEQIYDSEKLLTKNQQTTPYQSNLELQQALHFSEQNNQNLSRYHQQLIQNNVDLQSLYNKSETQNKKLQNELKLFQNRISLKESQLKQAQENGVQYMEDIAELKISIQKLNSTLTKMNEENAFYKDQLNTAETQNILAGQGLSSRKDLDSHGEFNLNRSKQSLNSRQQSQSFQNNSAFTHDNIQNYQNQILQFQKELAEKNQLIVGLQQQVKNLTDFQRQLLTKSQKKQHNKGLKNQIYTSPRQKPIYKVQINNESQLLTNRNLLNLINEQQKPDLRFHKTNQSEEFDVKILLGQVGPSIKSSITNRKSKQQLQQIYKKINQSTIYTAGLYSSLLDYQYLSNSKLLSSSYSKDTLQQ